MRTLAIDCATQACSVALFDEASDGATLLANAHDVLGRGHAERLIPMIAQLPDKGRADRILVSRGPGSFTGVRIGIAAAQGLGLAWSAQVLSYPTLALVGVMAQKSHTKTPVTVCMNGGHGEWFVQQFAADGTPATTVASLKPEQARAMLQPGNIVAGSKADAMCDGQEGMTALHILPDARDVLLLPGALLSSDLAPIYGRAPDAKPAQAKPAPAQTSRVKSTKTKPA